MKTFLGLLLVSVLLATGDSLECETCFGQGDSCTGQKQLCSPDLNTCQTLLFETTVAPGEQKFPSIVKSCSSEAGCELLKLGTTYNFPGTMTVIKEVICKAPSS
ncbi:phospholipase A2 inhibitor PIP-like [Sphaerodactylus townsendi]|nr:phospholipase A2 inhibitor PIP-like [Sphaerodactylus townsendi]